MKRKILRLKKVMAYECPHCSNVFEDEIDAYYCCTSLRDRYMWRCGKCRDLHDKKEDAQACCKKR
jgi:predicted RNA-binding Zn-ribbon protein involved in translation (DUF1610 family)